MTDEEELALETAVACVALAQKMLGVQDGEEEELVYHLACYLYKPHHRRARAEC